MSNPNDFLKHAQAAVTAAAILQKFDVEPALMLETAYRKRIRKVPDEISAQSAKRFAEMTRGIPVTPDEALLIYYRVCEGMWQRMTADEQRQWLLKVE